MSTRQCHPVHTKNPQHGSPDSGPVAAQPARATIASASSAMDNHRSLSPISDTPIRKVGSQCGIVWASAPRDPVLENLAPVFEKNGTQSAQPWSGRSATDFPRCRPRFRESEGTGEGRAPSQGAVERAQRWRASTIRGHMLAVGMVSRRGPDPACSVGQSVGWIADLPSKSLILLVALVPLAGIEPALLAESDFEFGP